MPTVTNFSRRTITYSRRRSTSPSDAQLRQPATGERIRQRQPRDAAQHPPGGDRALDRLDLVELRADPPAAPPARHRPVQRLARAGARLAHHPYLGQRLIDSATAGSGERMIGRAEHRQLVVQPVGLDQIGVLIVALDQREIEIVAQHPLRDLLRVVDRQRDLGHRPQRAIALDQSGGEVIADRERRAQPQRPRPAASAQQIVQLARPVQQFKRARQQHPPGLVEVQPPAHAIEQRPARSSFQFGQRGAGRRLRYCDGFGPGGHVFQPGDRGEDFEMAERKLHRLSA